MWTRSRCQRAPATPPELAAPRAARGRGRGRQRGPTHPLCAHAPSQAIELLAQCQECSKYFRDFDFQQLLDLVHELDILRFKENETVLFQGEPATFFGVILRGSLMPVIGGAPVGAARSVGEVIGEMALFSGGTRNVSIVAAQDGYLAVFAFAQLERLKESNPSLANKINAQLALAALEKQLETEGKDASRMVCAGPPHRRASAASSSSCPCLSPPPPRTSLTPAFGVAGVVCPVTNRA